MSVPSVREPLPPGPVTTIETPRGSYVAIAVERPEPAGGNVWRIARPYDAAVVRQVSERFVEDALVIVFRTVGTGTTSIVLALTLGETSTALATSTFRIAVV